MNTFASRFRVLPLLVLVAMAVFAVRMGDAFLGVRDIAAGALAEQAAALEPAAGDELPEAADAPQPADDLPAGDDAAAGAADNASPDNATLPEVWADPALDALNDTPEQRQLFEDLSARRQALDARERGILAKEALLAATENQINDKLAELTDLKNQIEDLLKQQETQELERINSLVKIYEGMKARDAAGIFNQMDMDILVQVVSRMSERKSAPIMAAMDKAKANQLTVMLSEMDKLPAARTDFRGVSGGPVATQAPAGSAPLPGLDALGAP